MSSTGDGFGGSMEDPAWGAMVPDQPAGGSVPPPVPPGRSRPPWLIPGSIAAAVVVIAGILIALLTGGGSHHGGGASAGTSTTAATSAPTVPATTAAPTTTVPASTTVAPTTTVAPPTKAQLESVLVSQSVAGPGAQPVQVSICGNFVRPTLYAASGYSLATGRARSAIFSLAGYYPSAAVASAQFAPIESSAPTCASGGAAVAPLTPVASQTLCDQSFEGQDTLTISGSRFKLFYGLVRCGPELGAVEVVTTDSAASPTQFWQVVGSFATRLQSLNR